MEDKLFQFLKKCKTIKQLKQIHLQILVNGLQENTFLVPKFMSVSSTVISLDYAINTFQSLCNPNLIAYNTLIKCFIGKTCKEAMLTYNEMRASMVLPNSFTFTSLLRCFEPFEGLREGKIVHAHIVKLGSEGNVFVMNALVDFYAKCCENLNLASQVFEEMPERDVVSWNTMIGAYMNRGKIEAAIRLFESMPERNTITWNSVIGGLAKAGNMDLAYSVFQRMPERNDVSWNTMISSYIKVGDLKTAQTIFNEMPEKSVVSWTAMVSGYSAVGDLQSARNLFDQIPHRNVVSWNAMISGYVNCHMFDNALSVFHEMLTDGKCRPDQSSLVSVLCACAHLGSHDHGQWVDSYIKKTKTELTVPLGNALIDMYAKCGDVENARAVFQRMRRKCVITWTTMISGLAVNGYSVEALELYYEMQSEGGVEPDEVVFIAVLTACNHGGLLNEGKRVFEEMVNDFEIKPRMEHYGCMVDLLGRAGKLEEALKFTESMHLEPNAVIWATLLSACRNHRKGEFLESLLTNKILNQEPANPAYLTLITNLSSSVGKWQDAVNFLRGAEKVPGCSSIQIGLGNGVHEFVATDTRHAERKEIYEVLGRLNGQLKSLHLEYLDYWSFH